MIYSLSFLITVANVGFFKQLPSKYVSTRLVNFVIDKYQEETPIYKFVNISIAISVSLA